MKCKTSGLTPIAAVSLAFFSKDLAYSGTDVVKNAKRVFQKKITVTILASAVTSTVLILPSIYFDASSWRTLPLVVMNYSCTASIVYY